MPTAFWDSSALVPLCVRQSSTAAAEQLARQYGTTVWWATPIEVHSALARLSRTGFLSPNGQVQALVALEHLRRQWREILPRVEVRERAGRFIDRFPLHTADAFQLAAAWIWCQGHPRNRAFISGDSQLLQAARQLGFAAIQT